jgi:hypothetical protein
LWIVSSVIGLSPSIGRRAPAWRPREWLLIRQQAVRIRGRPARPVEEQNPIEARNGRRPRH